jgi:hypothetical protein
MMFRLEGNFTNMRKTNVVHVGVPFAKSGLVDFTCPFCESVHHCSFMLLPVLNFLNGYVSLSQVLSQRVHV